MPIVSRWSAPLRRAPGYRQARDIYNRLARPSLYQQRQRLLGILGEFTRPGALVFDVGANRGVYTEAFAALGCQVVAVEPNPSLASRILARSPQASLEQKAVADKPGTAKLKVGRQANADLVSTLSDRFARDARELIGISLDDEIAVEVTTLDLLAAKHGEPRFVKLDVEGYERQALLGMSFRPAGLSFEFHGSMLDELDACLQLLDGYSFRVSAGNDYHWSSPWGDRQQALDVARELAADDVRLFADVYCR